MVATTTTLYVVRCVIWDDEGFPMTGAAVFRVETPKGSYCGATQHGSDAVWIWDELKPSDKVVVDCLGQSKQAGWVASSGTPGK